jgi:hypothetical protein
MYLTVILSDFLESYSNCQLENLSKVAAPFYNSINNVENSAFSTSLSALVFVCLLFCFVLFLKVLGIEPVVSYIPGKHSTTQLFPEPLWFVFFILAILRLLLLLLKQGLTM